MSICLAQDTLNPAWQLVLIFGGLGIAGVVAALTGVYKPASVLGPNRLRSDQRIWMVGAAAVVGVIVWLGPQIAYVAPKQAEFVRTHPGEKYDFEKSVTAADFAYLSTVPFALGYVALLVMDYLLGATEAIGGALRKLPSAIVKGAIGFLIVAPLLFFSGWLLESLYNAFHYQHPTAHILLEAMKGVTSPTTKALLIIGACIAAPVFEEYFFRGHLQTFLMRIVNPPPTAPQPVIPVLEEASGATETTVPIASTRRISRVWLAILITSVLFSAAHPLWMAPLIFLLSLCLGYAYERTGNIWVPVVIHALFNTLNTLQFLYLM